MHSVMTSTGVNAVEAWGQSPAETATAMWPLRAVRKGETKSLEAVHCEMVGLGAQSRTIKKLGLGEGGQNSGRSCL